MTNAWKVKRKYWMKITSHHLKVSTLEARLLVLLANESYLSCLAYIVRTRIGLHSYIHCFEELRLDDLAMPASNVILASIKKVHVETPNELMERNVLGMVCLQVYYNLQKLH